MASNLFAQMGYLSRFILQQDRLRLSLWIISLTFFTLIVPLSFKGLYSSQQERDAMAQTMANPAMTAMTGPANLNNYTLGVMTTHQMLLMTATVVAIMSILLVTRHTRANEEDGRLEMLRALPTGRLSYLNAALLVLTVTCITLALISGFGLYILGIESMNLEGSLLYGTALGATGLFFAGVTAVFAQLSDSSRGTIGYSIGALLIAYLFRAITDVSNETLSWISPLAWVTKAKVYDDNNWWPIVFMILTSFVLYILANYLNAIRDVDRGFLPSKPGRKYASIFLQSPIGLALRLQRVGMISWAIGMYVLGASYGSVLGDLETFFSDNEAMKQLLPPVEGVSLIEQFIPMLMIVVSLLATIPPVMSMNKLRSEEKKERIVHLLAKNVSRTKLIGSYFMISIVNGFIMLSLAAFGLWSVGTTVVEGGLSFEMIVGAAISYYPATLVMISIAVLLIGIFPRFTSFIWLYVFYSFIVLYLGGLFQFPDWVGNISPYGHVPQTPIEDFSLLPLILLSMVAMMLTAIGVIGFNKRDIEG
ncbi:ABC-2 type transport system permease protein [Bacillus mesophilus]|uniref:ABC transporter permease n=1 Tax=Bacillus mesophilus TaxID=1808955 RepID=A0A6M0QB58_9BACI|nr:ABC transporter permease [Bacillus mesophilus]MBM7662967.1 ABC-2 type transport system permease protein [Bacillus mesophilus]NEY73555.1 ABC transporter permease [Bacillus mesophilus]